ncbi:thioredoxin-like domain-containing protein [Polaribacter sp.]|uniref:thioredoxin-like domain-containing protein n=1 Tax=Polaribacter sp. TaxID=1920175 RepID=UPI003EF918DE
MRTLIVLTSCVFFLLTSCNSVDKTEKTPTGYTIDGTLPTTSNSSLVYLMNEKNEKIDSSKVVDHIFQFKGFVKSASAYHLQLQNAIKKHPVIIENGKFTVFINDKNTTIIGGDLNSKQQVFNALKIELNAQKLMLLDSFMVDKISKKDLKKSIKGINKTLKKINTDYVIDNANNLLSSTLLATNFNFSLEELKMIKSNSKIIESSVLHTVLTEEIRKLQTIYDQKLADEKRVKAAKKIYRKPAIMFTGDGLQGEVVSLQSVIKGKKVILVDFWASWCGPCRMVTPRVRELYNKYKNKGFTILTVSEDKNTEDWKNGIEQDNMLSWNHVFDDYGRISSMYGIRSIPYMVLIDGNGGIIKEKITITELEYQLKKLL